MGGDMYRIQLNCDAQMFYSLFKAPAFLQNLVTETIATKKSFWILGDHLAKRIDVHGRYSRYGNIIALQLFDEPVERLGEVAAESVQLLLGRSRDGNGRTGCYGGFRCT